MASAPSTLLGQRRLRVLRAVGAAKAPASVPLLSRRLGWSTATVRTHLHFLLELQLVTRINYRRWSLKPGLSLGDFDAAALDPLER